MNARQPAPLDNVELVAFPLQLVKCRVCNRDYPRQPGREAKRGHCSRCGGPGRVYTLARGARAIHLTR